MLGPHKGNLVLKGLTSTWAVERLRRAVRGRLKTKTTGRKARLDQSGSGAARDILQGGVADRGFWTRSATIILLLPCVTTRELTPNNLSCTGSDVTRALMQSGVEIRAFRPRPATTGATSAVRHDTRADIARAYRPVLPWRPILLPRTVDADRTAGRKSSERI